MLKLDGVSKSYNGQIVLHPTDLHVEAGQSCLLIGPSGCGKSTLLRLAIGLIDPDTGAVYFQGTEMSGDAVLSQRHKMGYVIQEGGLFPHLTARWNVGLMARYLGWDEKRILQRLDELVELTHLPSDALDRYPGQLSGGQRQRVSLMRALMLDPDLLLLDEPLAALDPMIRADLQNDLRDIFRSLGKTVVMVTHDISEAAFFSDSINLMRDGRIVQRGSLDDLLHSPADEFVTQFVSAQNHPLSGGGR
jgi:osmoprotectant transport system ATP-binding protein